MNEVKRVFRAVLPDGSSPWKSSATGTFPTWVAEGQFTEEEIRKACAWNYPDAILQVRETVVYDWRPVEPSSIDLSKESEGWDE